MISRAFPSQFNILQKQPIVVVTTFGSAFCKAAKNLYFIHNPLQDVILMYYIRSYLCDMCSKQVYFYNKKSIYQFAACSRRDFKYYFKCFCGYGEIGRV